MHVHTHKADHYPETQKDRRTSLTCEISVSGLSKPSPQADSFSVAPRMVGGVPDLECDTAVDEADAARVAGGVSPVLSLAASLAGEVTWMGGGLHPRIAARFARGEL